MPLKKFVITQKPLKKVTAHMCHCSKLLCLTSHSVRVLFVFCRLMWDRQVKLSILPLAVPHQTAKNPGGERARGRLRLTATAARGGLGMPAPDLAARPPKHLLALPGRAASSLPAAHTAALGGDADGLLEPPAGLAPPRSWPPVTGAPRPPS